MASENKFVSKTQHYLKVKKPLIERQRRARINKCLEALKTLVAEFQGDDAILRMDKAEMLESTIAFMRKQSTVSGTGTPTNIISAEVMNSFRNGYMNAVGEVSRTMASTPGMNVELGKVVMTRLGCEFNRMLRTTSNTAAASATPVIQPVYVETTSATPMSPASSGYHSDYSQSPMTSPVQHIAKGSNSVWRPW